MDSSKIWYIDHILLSYPFQTFFLLKIEMIFLIFQFFGPFCKKKDADCHRACDTFLKMSLDTLSIWPCVNTFQNPYKKLTAPPHDKNFHPSNFLAVISRQPIALGSWNVIHIFLLDFCISIFFGILNFLFFWQFLDFSPAKFAVSLWKQFLCMDSSNIWYIYLVSYSVQTFFPLKIEMIFLKFLGHFAKKYWCWLTEHVIPFWKCL